MITIAFADGVLRRETVNNETYLVYDVYKTITPGKKGPGYWIRGAESVAYTKILGRSVLLTLLIIIPFILLLTALGGYYITKKAFLPVNNIVRTADEIYLKNDMKARVSIEPDVREDELYNLSITLNRMLDRIESLIVQEKQFTSDASHELRTPISVILAQGEYLLDIAETDKQKELAQDIVIKANQASKLISRLLMLARIDQNRQKINKEKINFNAVADIVVQNMGDLASQKNINLLTSIQGDVMIYADETLITSAVSNLVSNAIKYGKESGYVMISALQFNGNVEIVVKDNGIGISREHIEKIWTRFYRVDEVRNDEYGSCGLGLSMVKSIVELHGGDITVQSVLGEGTEFRIIMKNSTKVLAVAAAATMILSSGSVFAVETETTTDFERPAFAMNMKAKDSKFKFGKMFELTEEQKAAMAEKIESGEFKLGEKGFGKKMFNGEKPELTEEQKAARAEKIASGELKPMAKVGKRMKAFAKKAPKLNVETVEVVE